MRLVKANWLVCVAALLAFAPSSAQAGDQGHTKDKKDKEHTKTEEPTVPVVVEETPVVVEETPVVTEIVPVVEPALLLTCAEIAAILIADNTAEVTVAQHALLRALSPLVRNYALQLVTAHSVLSAQIMAQGVIPLENDISARVTAAGTEEVALLAVVPPLGFDRVFMQQQIVSHQRMLDLIDGVLLPAAVDPASRNLLVNARIAEANHLALAVSISAGLL